MSRGTAFAPFSPLSTLYVGIDVSSKSNYVCALDFYKNKYINSSFANNQPGAEELAQKILECLKEHPDLNTVVAALESTSVYSIHIANYLSSCEELVSFLAEKSRNRIKDISKTADLLKKAARDSYRLDKALYEPLNVSIASSFNCIETFKKEVKVIDAAIEREINCTPAYRWIHQMNNPF